MARKLAERVSLRNVSDIENQREQQPKEQAAASPEEQDDLTLWQMFASAAAAAFGVQSSRNRERDFAKGRALPFIAVGIIFTAAFVLALVFVVSLVLPDS